MKIIYILSNGTDERTPFEDLESAVKAIGDLDPASNWFLYNLIEWD